MEQQQDMIQTGADYSGAASGVAVGSTLRAAREAMGLSVGEVAGRLKFAPRQIEALEAGDFGQLPEMAFVRGFVRAYARLVQVDELPLLGALPGAPAPAAVEVRGSGREVPRQGAESRKQNLFWIGGALLVVVLGIIAWKYDAGESMHKDKQVAQSAPAETAGQSATAQGTEAAQTAEPAAPGGMVPTDDAAKSAGTMQASGTTEPSGSTHVESTHVTEPAHAAAPTRSRESTASPASNQAPAATTSAIETAPAPTHTRKEATPGVTSASGVPPVVGPSRLVHLEFTEDSWVEVTDGTGRILLSMLGKAGMSRNAAGPTPLSVVVGNAKGVKLFYKGQPVELVPGRGSDVARLKLE